MSTQAPSSGNVCVFVCGGGLFLIVQIKRSGNGWQNLHNISNLISKMVRIKNQTKKENADLFPGLTDGFPSLQSLPRHKLQIKDELTRILPVFGAEYN